MRTCLRYSIVLVLLAGLAATPARPAAASPLCPETAGTWWYFWRLHFSYDASPGGVLTVEVHCLDSGGNLVYFDALDEVAPCAPAGEVFLRAGRAYFPGGHFQCTFPDLNGAVVALTGGEASLPAMDSYAGLKMQAIARAGLSAQGDSGGNPIFSTRRRISSSLFIRTRRAFCA